MLARKSAWWQALAGVLLLFCGIYALFSVRLSPRGSPPAQPTLPPAVHHPENWIDPDGIVIHCSDSPWKIGRRVVDEVCINEIHETDHPHWATLYEGRVYHIGYHYIILPDGTVQKGRPDHCLGAHARHFNHYLGICLVGAFIGRRPRSWTPKYPTRQQLRSLISLCERLMVHYHIPPSRVVRHSDVGHKECPGRRFPYAAIMQELRAFAARRPLIARAADPARRG